MRAPEQRRAAKAQVPNVVGREWIEARDVLGGKGLVAINAQPDNPARPWKPRLGRDRPKPGVRRTGQRRIGRPTVAAR